MKKHLKKIYKSLPFKKELFICVRFFLRPPQNIYKHLHFKGRFKVQLSTGSSFKIRHFGFMIENEIFWKGIDAGWEKYSLGLWQQLSLRSNCIFDIGANTGIYSLVAKAIKPNASVHAFEPVARVFQKLQENIGLNRFDTKCNQVAVSNQTGHAEIYDTASEHTLSVSVNKNINPNPSATFPVQIETIRLDDYIEKEGIEEIDLMKIDVEMHEVEALNGFSKYFPKFQPTIIIEILNDEIASAIERIVEDYNYLYFNIDESTGVKQVDHLTKSDHFNFLLCKEDIAQEIGLISND